MYYSSYGLKEIIRIVGLLYQAATVPAGSCQIRRSSLMASAVSLAKFMLLVSRLVSTGGPSVSLFPETVVIIHP